MATSFERMQAAWESPERRVQLNCVVETMATEGATRDELDDALGRLLDEVRARGADDTEEIIMSVGDRLHGWCHPSGQIKPPATTVAAEAQASTAPSGVEPPIQPSHG